MNRPAGPPPAVEGADTTSVLAVVWCRSVGTFWTLELHQLGRGTPHTTLLAWISSGVPITEPEPSQAMARTLLAEHGLRLFSDSFAGPCTGTRRGIGYAIKNDELIAFARLLVDQASETGHHPVTMAAQWIAAGYSAQAAARWISQGIYSPHAAQHAPHNHSLAAAQNRPPTRTRPQRIHQP